MKKTKGILGVMVALACVIVLNVSSIKVFASSEEVTSSTETQADGVQPAATQTFVNVFFDLAGGTISITHPYSDRPSPFVTDNYGDGVMSGTTVAQKGVSVTDPVFWDPARKFLGWKICDSEWKELDSNLYTTDGILNYVIPNQTVIFSAQWEGSSWDYYSEVMVYGFGGQIPVTVHEGRPDGTSVDVDRETEICEAYLRENEVPIFEQTKNDYSIIGDPVKSGAVFEGWLQFSYENVNLRDAKDFNLLSENLYTTNEITRREVAEYNVIFVAKWSDVSMSAYYEKFGIETTVPAEENYNVDIKTDLQAVPVEIADIYDSVEDMKDKMVSIALSSNETMTTDNTRTIFVDVTLQIQNANGQWETVTAGSFPTEGVETLLPYPEGTNKDSFDFIISHMITTGGRAGEVEVLVYTLEDNGIKVKFTSMSPVAITYKEKVVESETEATTAPTEAQTEAPTAEPTTEAPTTEAPTEESTTAALSPQTGDATPVLLYVVIMLASMAAVISIFLYNTKKEKSQ